MNKEKFKGILIGIIATFVFSVGITPTFAQYVTKTISVAINKINISVDGTKINSDNILYNGTTYVPLKAISEMLGKEVVWDADTNTACINSKPVNNNETVNDVATIDTQKELYYTHLNSYKMSVEAIKKYIGAMSEGKDISQNLSGFKESVKKYKKNAILKGEPIIDGFETIDNNTKKAFDYLELSMIDLELAANNLKQFDLDETKKYMESAMDSLETSTEFYKKAMDELDSK